MIANDKTQKETAYKLENIIEKVEEGGYGEEIEETELVGEAEGERELEEGDEIYKDEPEEGDEKEYVREAADIGAFVRIQ